MKTKRKIIISLLSIVVIMFLLPLLCSTVMNSRSASGLVFLMLFCINPVFLIDIGITAGTELKKLWFLPVLTAFLFPFLFWLAIWDIETDILIYSAIYLVVGLLAMFITSVISKKKQGNGKNRESKKHSEEQQKDNH